MPEDHEVMKHAVKSESSSYVPRSAAARWLDARLPVLGLAHSAFVAFPSPRNLNYFWTFGGILTFMLLSQIVTGVALAMHYTPQASLAFGSIEHIMRDVDYGWLIRTAHADGASMFFLALYVHIFRGLYYGSYKAPREVLWLLGVVIYLLAMATGFTGAVLPWSQVGYWGATVITSLFSAIPVVGPSVTHLLWGGFAVGDATLNRFFALHYLLPFMIVGVVMLHIWALHVPGSNNPAGIEAKSPKDTLPFHPYVTAKDGLALACFLVLYAWVVFFAPNAFDHADNAIQANPLVTPERIVPAWYYLPFFAILRSVPGAGGGAFALLMAVGLLAFLPWLDTSPVRSANYRPLYRVAFWVFVADVVLLGILGSRPPIGATVWLGQLCTAYYFIHLLVLLPLLGVVERPVALPPSIAEAVLGPPRGGSAGAITAGATSSPNGAG